MAYHIAEADDWEEVPLSRVFGACAEAAHHQALTRCPVVSISSSLASGLATTIPMPHLVIDIHREICKTAEFKLTFLEFGQWMIDNPGKHEERALLVHDYFVLLSLWANDCGLTLQYRSDTYQFEIVHNTCKGPKLWT